MEKIIRGDIMKKERNKELAAIFYWSVIAFVWYLIAFLKWNTEGVTWIVVINLIVGILSSINAILGFVKYRKRKDNKV